MPISRIRLPEGELTFSRLAWGMGSLPMTTTVQDMDTMLGALLDIGITTVDNAENYGGYTREELLGKALALAPGRRSKLQLVTKCGCVGETPLYPTYRMYHYDTSREHILAAAENSLRCFGTDRIDVLLLHRPDPLMNADEVAEAFVRLRDAGKVLHFGVSNFLPSQISLLASRLPFPLVANEFQFSVMHPDPLQDGSLEECQRSGCLPLAWGPLGRGALYTGTDERAVRVRSELETVAGELGAGSIGQVALAWLLRHPARVVPILGTGFPSELHGMEASEHLKMDRQQWYRILNASLGYGLP